MGSQCSAVRRGKIDENGCYKHNQKEERVPTAEKRGEEVQRVESGTIKETAEETLRTEKETSSEKTGGRQNSSALGHKYAASEVNKPSHVLSQTHDPTEEEEAAWVDKNRADLIQTVPLVMPIADQMLQKQVLHKEMYANIEAAGTNQEKMRVLYRALTSTKAKSVFFRILQEIKAAACEKDDIKEVIKKHKAYLRERFTYEFEGTDKNHSDARSLDEIYTELHIIQGESERVNTEHEIWELEDKSRSQTAEGTKINCNDIFKSTSEGSVSAGQSRNARTVMTKGIAGIGKTVSVKKFILDWADGRANQDLDFIFVLQFRELNLVLEDKFSLETLVKQFHSKLKNVAVAKIFATHRVLFIFDGLDETQLQLDFKKAKILTDATKEASVDILVTNLIREHLLPSALVWITSRPGAIKRIPRKHVYQWTEVRGFNDAQKIQYFRNRVEDKAIAERIIKHILMSRSLYIMCHIPIFCWIAAKVFQYLLRKMDTTHDENMTIPTTLTEMYTHFLFIQMQIATEKYDLSDTEEIFKLNEEFIFKLGKMAFEQLNKGSIIFTGNDLKIYGIDIEKAGVHCGLCTEIFKEEHVFNTKKLYCFVHLTVQEYFAALFVYRCFASKKIDSLSLKDFLLKGSEEELKSTLDNDPVDLPLDELIEISIGNSTLRKTGELDMFLRFLTGMSLRSTQELLQGLIQQTEEHSAVVEEIRKSLLGIDLGDCSPERCLNLVHCLIELKDSSLHDTVRQYLKPDSGPETEISPVQCSALADSILMSNTPLDEFDLRKYRPSAKGIFRLVPAVRNCRKARLSGVDFNKWTSETVASALLMPNSVLTELHLINSGLYAPKNLIDALTNCQCKLEALSFAGLGIVGTECEKLALAIKSVLPNLRELELSGNVLKASLCSVLSVGLCNSKLETLRLNRNDRIAKICEELVTSALSNPCYLRELEMTYTYFGDAEMQTICTWLMSKTSTLEVLSLSHNKLSEKGCETLASALSSETCRLRELDMSYNNLGDSGVMVLCEALMKPHCGLKTLRLSFCKVAQDGCACLVSALRSDHCSLRELDLSFNHLPGQGVEQLTEMQRDSCYSLEKLSVDHNEECWIDLKLLRKYACDLTLDPNTAGVHIVVTEDKKMATYDNEKQPYPEHSDRFPTSQVLCEDGLTGRHYWEVECVLADVGVAYKSIKRDGDCSSEYSLGGNEKSWCWDNEGRFLHNSFKEEFLTSTKRSTIGVYLDWPAGILCFFEVFTDELTLLYSVRTTFTEPLHPGFSLAHGSVRLCKIK
ncbi:protein NLRC3-like isoform X2 [Mastacembelus armatus]|uniref:protein NLRC3-like isoform X2 n=1 Tax=Mastacembelus armatus TaxID=205130 RepID=UPI000E466259|nr:protein NLRC3-like isoform X2 [Mastacembelus armatus]